MRGYDPIDNKQLTREEIKRCEADELARLELISSKTIESLPPRKKDTKESYDKNMVNKGAYVIKNNSVVVPIFSFCKYFLVTLNGSSNESPINNLNIT